MELVSQDNILVAGLVAFLGFIGSTLTARSSGSDLLPTSQDVQEVLDIRQAQSLSNIDLLKSVQKERVDVINTEIERISGEISKAQKALFQVQKIENPFFPENAPRGFLPNFVIRKNDVFRPELFAKKVGFQRDLVAQKTSISDFIASATIDIDKLLNLRSEVTGV